MWKRKKAKDNDRVEPQVTQPAPPLDEAPTQPAPRLEPDDAPVWQGQPVADQPSDTPDENSGRPDAPHPADADAPTVAIAPEYERKLPDAPSVNESFEETPQHSPSHGGEETVQVGRRPPLDPTEPPALRAPPATDAGDEDGSASDLDPTIPMGRRRS